jgi:hypothetical protein
MCACAHRDQRHATHLETWVQFVGVVFSIANSEYFILARVHVLLVEFQSSLQVISDVN